MKILILDTSSDFLYLYLSNGKEEYQVVLEGKNNHSEKLMPLIEEGLQKLNLEVKDLERIICGIGPGSYTGLRIGLTVCKIFAWTSKIPLYTISSLDILGSGYFNKDGLYAIINTAKKGWLYTKVIEVVDKKVTTIIEDSFVEKEEFLNNLDKNVKVINEENFSFNHHIIMEMATNQVMDIHSVVPNYLRKANS